METTNTFVDALVARRNWGALQHIAWELYEAGDVYASDYVTAAAQVAFGCGIWVNRCDTRGCVPQLVDDRAFCIDCDRFMFRVELPEVEEATEAELEAEFAAAEAYAVFAAYRAGEATGRDVHIAIRVANKAAELAA